MSAATAAFGEQLYEALPLSPCAATGAPEADGTGGDATGSLAAEAGVYGHPVSAAASGWRLCTRGKQPLLAVGLCLNLVAGGWLLRARGIAGDPQPARAAPSSLEERFGIFEFGVGALELFGGMNPLEFQCPLPGILRSDDEPAAGIANSGAAASGRRLVEATSAEDQGCCRSYDRIKWPYQFPECKNSTSCETCWKAVSEFGPDHEAQAIPAAKYAGVAWAAAASVASPRDRAGTSSWVAGEVKNAFRHVVGDGPDGVNTGRLEEGAMTARMGAGFDHFDADVCPNIQGWEVKMLDDDKGNIHARVYKSEAAKLAIVAFRGTKATSLKNWHVDADIVSTKLELGDDGPTADVHEGFLNEAKRVLPRVKDWLNGYMLGMLGGIPDDWTVVFAGHSLGGALALLVATLAEVEEWDRRPDAVVVFGAPRVADGTLDAWWRERGMCSRLVRVNVYNDVIHWMPFAAIWNFKDVLTSFLGCMHSVASCLDSQDQDSTVFSERWTHVCDESELIVPSPTRGVNVHFEDFSPIGGVLSHFVSNCDFGYGFGVSHSSVAAVDAYCGISPDLCKRPEGDT